jgi:hypothetical protein
MAKRKGRDDVNVSAAIRDVLTENRGLSGREVLEVVKQKHPDKTINEKSFSVAFSNARRKLGIKGRRGRKRVMRRKPGAGLRPSAAPGINFDLLQAARKYLSIAGNADTAVSAIRQLQALQIG